MIELNVKKRLGNGQKDEFLLDISFTVGNGITVLLGSSGSGKTTTLKLIAGILSPDEGFIKVDGETYFDSTKNINLSIQKRRIGFVFQDYVLFPHLTALQNIAYGIKSHDKSVKRDKSIEMLTLLQIEHLKNRLPHELSGGEKQRVALARALASDPAIVLLDEPLSAVDVETRLTLLYEIEKAQNQTNIPFIYITHNHLEAERLGNQQIILQNGRIFDE